MRTLRAIAARGGSWGLLAAVVAVGVGAAVAAAGVAGDAREAARLPLVLVTVLVVAGVSTELARRRRAEMSLVRVRGAYGPWLLSSVAGQALLAVLAGGAVGLALVAVVGIDGLGWGLLMTGVAAVPAVGASVAVASEPLAVALRRRSWSGPTGRWAFAGLVLALAVVVAAALAVYRADTEDPGALVLAGPALLGLAAGQLVVWLHRAVGRWTLTTSRSSLGLLLGIRRALAPDHATTIRALVAAGTVAAASLCAVAATDDWADETARIGNGGPVQLAMPDGDALQTLLVTEQVDPDGRWLMAAAVNDKRVEPQNRIAWLDLERYDRVAGAHLSGTAGDVRDLVADLRDAPGVTFVAGDRLDVATSSATGATVTLDYLDDNGVQSSIPVEIGATGNGSAPIAHCAESCVLLGLEASKDVSVSTLELGGTDLLPAFGGGPLAVVSETASRPVDTLVPEPVVTAGTTKPPSIVEGIGGSTRGVDVVGERDALPLLYGAGAVADLRVGVTGAGGSVPAVRSVVLARADTPPSVLDDLVAAGAEKPRDWQPSVRVLSDREHAEERVARVTAAAAVLLGGLVLLSGRRRRSAANRHERAALRLVGVPRSVGRRAARVEAALLVVTVAVPTYLASWLAATTVVDGVGLVSPGPTGLPFGSVVDQGLIVPVAVATGLAVVVGLVVVRVGGRAGSAPAALLAEEDAG